ncbi:MAG: Zn-dependent hydrolase [Bacteroidota bacterium]
MKKTFVIFLILYFVSFSCGENIKEKNKENTPDSIIAYRNLLKRYKVVSLNVDYSILSEKEKQMIPIFFEISKIIDEIFWYQSFGYKDSLCKIKGEELQKLIEINFGPWDRFNNNEPILNCVGIKPEGANFYPPDMKKKEFLSFETESKKSAYTFIRRNEEGKLISIPYHIALSDLTPRLSILLKTAASLSEDENFHNYLMLLEEAFRTDNYSKSDIAWLATNENQLDFIGGPIEIYDDQLFGYKAEYESFLMIRDSAWTNRLSKYSLMLPFLQKALPVEKRYRHESPNLLSELEVYNIINWGGAAKAGGYSISVSYPDLENIPDTISNRNIHFVNAISEKYEHIIQPINKTLISNDQQIFCTFEAFFLNNVFWELGLHLGINNVLSSGEPVRKSLKEYATVLNLVKSIAMSLYISEKLYSVGEIENIKENYTTYICSMFRTIRFGKSSPYSISNIILFNYLTEKKAIKRNVSGKYSINYDKLQEAIPEIINKVITIQGDGNYEAAREFINSNSEFSKDLLKSLNKLSDNQVPIDILFKDSLDINTL